MLMQNAKTYNIDFFTFKPTLPYHVVLKKAHVNRKNTINYFLSEVQRATITDDLYIPRIEMKDIYYKSVRFYYYF